MTKNYFKYTLHLYNLNLNEALIFIMFVERIKDLFEDRKLSYFYGKIPFFSKKL